MLEGVGDTEGVTEMVGVEDGVMEMVTEMEDVSETVGEEVGEFDAETPPKACAWRRPHRNTTANSDKLSMKNRADGAMTAVCA